jgi:hypothetical protein
VRGVARVVDDHHLPRRELSLDFGAEEVEGAALGGEQPVVFEPSEDERPDPVRVTEADELSLCEENRREGALDSRHRPRNRLLERPLVAGDQGRDHFGVRGGTEPRAVGEKPGAELARVCEVAVVAQRDGSCASLLDDRLRVRPVRGPGGRVAGVADGDLAAEAA